MATKKSFFLNIFSLGDYSSVQEKPLSGGILLKYPDCRSEENSVCVLA